MNQKVCENHLYVNNPSLTLANRQSYRLAQGLSKLAPNAASETRQETMVVFLEWNTACSSNKAVQSLQTVKTHIFQR